MKKLDYIVTNNIKNKYQCNDAIEYETKFYNRFSLSNGYKYPRTLVTVSLQGGKKHRATIIYGLTCLLGSGATNSMFKRQQANP